MSARVFNPVFYDLGKIHLPMMRQISSSNKAAYFVKKNLFGPVDREDAKSFVDSELAKDQHNKIQKWGFDFVNGHPLVGHDQYVWEPVSQAATTIPKMYTLSRAAHTRPSHINKDTIDNDDILLDERSNRSNNDNLIDDSNNSLLLLNSSIEDGSISSCSDSELNTSRQIIIKNNKNTNKDNNNNSNKNKISTSARTSSIISNLRSSASKKRKAEISLDETQMQLRSRIKQPKITDYMKETKRKSSTVVAKKMQISFLPSKKRTSATSSTQH